MASLRKTALIRGRRKYTPKNAVVDSSPLKWNTFFESEEQIKVDGDVFNVYTKGQNGPIVFLIHGGGYSALTWSLFVEDLLTKVVCQVVAIDLRGHGGTNTKDEEHLSLDILAGDIVKVVNKICETKLEPLVLVGHSLGGAVAVESARHLSFIAGVCIIDIVEGTAVESLSSMQKILRRRPATFNDVEQAIQWSFRSGQTSNIDAARVSMPGQIKNMSTLQLAACEISENLPSENTVERNSCFSVQDSAFSIIEENEKDIVENGESSSLFLVPNLPPKYMWRIDLTKTEPYWNGWFKGLSQKFLDIQVPKVLLLANIHGLDTVLTVGQMQGKFQLQVLPRSGHAVQEDQPYHVAEIIAGFLVKQKLATAINDFTPVMPSC
ncbi:hypothetical protein FQA39_LY04798 [Lamprigera yunnana]|nr:hypothetical protein FQA39_LY04798 [Lamprigera yunnana]